MRLCRGGRTATTALVGWTDGRIKSLTKIDQVFLFFCFFLCSSLSSSHRCFHFFVFHCLRDENHGDAAKYADVNEDNTGDDDINDATM